MYSISPARRSEDSRGGQRTTQRSEDSREGQRTGGQRTELGTSWTNLEYYPGTS